jgi:serine protease Do
MSVRTLIRNPVIAAVLGVAAIGAPVGVLFSGLGLATAPASAQAASPPAAVAVAPSGASPGGVLPDFSAMVQKYGPAVVNITVTTKQSAASMRDEGDDEDEDQGGQGGSDPFGPNSPFAPFFRGNPFQGQPQPMHGEGSGFIVRADGTILTNAHVVNGATDVTVKLTDRREYTAKVIGFDTRADVAVIKINARDLPTVKLGDSHNLKVGEWVLAIGAPFGFDNSATAGIVSAKGRVFGGEQYVPFIQTDVPINPGNSGGPLFNMRGEVVGINSQIYSRTGGYMGVSFSIPIDVALQVSHQLEATGHVSRGKLGVQIQPVSQGLADSFGLPRPEGALVSQVEQGSAAQRAGIQQGDVILKLNGQVVNDSDELPVAIASLSPGTTVNLEVWRNHQGRNMNVVLGAIEGTRTAKNATERTQGARLGLAVRPLSPDEQRQVHTKGGLLVERVQGAALDAGLRPGDVVLAANGSPIASNEDLRNAVDKSKGHIALLVQRGDTQVFIPVRIP